MASGLALGSSVQSLDQNYVLEPGGVMTGHPTESSDPRLTESVCCKQCQCGRQGLAVEGPFSQ